MIARGSDSDINVISLVGERGRELREFVEKDLGPEGMKKTVIVVSTSDQPAPMRIRASILATAIAEGFRNEGSKVLLLMDSLTGLRWLKEKLVLPQENHLHLVVMFLQFFLFLPKLLERTGTSESGAITAIYYSL